MFPVYLVPGEGPVLGLVLQVLPVLDDQSVGERCCGPPDGSQCGKSCRRELSEVHDFLELTFRTMLEPLDLDLAGGASHLPALLHTLAHADRSLPHAHLLPGTFV